MLVNATVNGTTSNSLQCYVRCIYSFEVKLLVGTNVASKSNLRTVASKLNLRTVSQSCCNNGFGLVGSRQLNDFNIIKHDFEILHIRSCLVKTLALVMTENRQWSFLYGYILLCPATDYQWEAIIYINFPTNWRF